MKRRVITLILTIVSISVFCQNNQDSVFRRHFISTSLWSIANLFPDPADFYELNYGYRFTKKDALIINATTWKYPEPLGIPFTNDKKNNNTEEYPGYIRAFGIGAIYQKYIWKQLYTSAHANAFIQNFQDKNDEYLQSGFQLYLQFRIGYRINIFRKRFFLEPALSFNYWPINTNFPDSFSAKEKNWPNYFLFEPHLNFGINF